MPDCEKSLDWIRVERILSPSDKKMYQAKLHDGEVEVMILAQEGVRADLVILDDNAAKKTAKYLGLTVTGTFGKSQYGTRKKLLHFTGLHHHSELNARLYR